MIVSRPDHVIACRLICNVQSYVDERRLAPIWTAWGLDPQMMHLKDLVMGHGCKPVRLYIE